MGAASKVLAAAGCAGSVPCKSKCLGEYIFNCLSLLNISILLFTWLYIVKKFQCAGRGRGKQYTKVDGDGVVKAVGHKGAENAKQAINEFGKK